MANFKLTLLNTELGRDVQNHSLESDKTVKCEPGRQVAMGKGGPVASLESASLPKDIKVVSKQRHFWTKHVCPWDLPLLPPICDPSTGDAPVKNHSSAFSSAFSLSYQSEP